MQPVFNKGHCHSLIVSPAGGGKTTALIIPNALAWRGGGLFCFDPKGEICAAVRKFRRRQGRRIVRLDPFHVLGPGGDTLNVLDGIRYKSPDFHAEIRAICEAVILKNPQDQNPHFNEAAEGYLAGILGDTLCTRPARERSLQTARTVLTSSDCLVEAIGRLARSDDEFLRRAGGKMLQFRDRELSSVLTTVSRQTDFLDDPLVYEFTKESSFDAQEALLDRRTDVFFILPPQYLKSHSRLSRLVITSLLRTLLRAGACRQRQVLWLLDETPSLGRLEILAEALTQFRGYGVRMVMVVQALAQLQQQFPEGQHETILANTDQIFLAIRDYPTAEEVSRRLGEHTVATDNVSENWGGGWSEGHQSESRSGNWGSTWGQSQVGRRLLRPEEVIALGKSTAVVFLQNLPPMLVRTCPYYQDSAWASGCQTLRLSLQECRHCLAILLSVLFLGFAFFLWSTGALSPQKSPARPASPAGQKGSAPELFFPDRWEE